MKFARLLPLAAVCALLAPMASPPAPAGAAGNDQVVVANIGDMSGVYSALDGAGAVLADQMAIDDFGGKVLGKPIKLVSFDHRNDPGLANQETTEAIDRDHATLLLDYTNSATALAGAGVAKEKHVIQIVTGGGTDALTNDPKYCNPYTYHYGYDVYALAHGTAATLTKQGGKKWYTITANYAFGHALYNDVKAAVEANGGKVLGNDDVPLGTSDFSTYLLKAKSSGADVLGLDNAGNDTVNAMKQINEFGMKKNMKIGVMLLFESDVHALGPDYWAGSTVTIGGYWDLDAKSRAFAARFAAKNHGNPPTWSQFANYSAVTTYLEAVKRAGTTDPLAVEKQLVGYHFSDAFARNAYIRPQDHLLIHDMYLAQVLPASEVKQPWAYFKILKVIPGAEAYRPLSEVKCHLGS
ncbi:MAG TPA: ABC transporter substrate-binding protein [Candidatus Dormibacteraeota bacterium]|nr:ABC transporter substrate-binding protein [Candidatus Dormibacteraeota bacterium]